MHLLHVFPSFQLGGSQRRFAALANHFGSRYRHSIVSLDGNREATSLLGPQVLYDMIPSPPKAGLFTTLLQAHGVMRRLKPALLVTYNWGAMEWAAANVFHRARHLHIEDGFGPEEAQGQLRRRVLFRRVVLNLKGIVVLPSHTLVTLATNTWRISPKRVTYVPNGIPCARFQHSADADTLAHFRGSGPVIGTVATLRKEKALDRLITAFGDLRRLQPVRLVIVGDGPERAALEALTMSLGLADCVTFTGSLSCPEKAVTAFDIFALSSDTEQMPLSVLEAMAAGLPIAATDVGDIQVMVAEQNRAFVVAKDAGVLANAISTLLADRVLRHSLGAANRLKAEAEYDEAAMFRRYDELFLGHA